MRSAVLFNFLIEANIMASVAIVLMIPLRKILRRKLGNTALCFGWLLIAIRLLCPVALQNPFIHELRPASLTDTAIRPIAGQVKVQVVNAISDEGIRLLHAGDIQGFKRMTQAATGVNYNGTPEILAWILIAGMAAILLWFILMNIRFRKKMKSNRIEEISGDLKEHYLRLCEEQKVKPVPVYFTDPAPGACLVGIFRPYIILPVLTAPKDIISALSHEICHLKNRDHIRGALWSLCCVIHWFNPLVWLAAAMSKSDSEMRCDDRVIASMDEQERKEYAGVLLREAARKSVPGFGIMATGMTMSGKRLRNRVVAIVRHNKPLRCLTVAFAVIAAGCLVLTFCTMETAQEDRISDVLDREPVYTIPDHDEREMPQDLSFAEKKIWELSGFDYEQMAPYREVSEGYHDPSGSNLIIISYMNSQGLDRYCTLAEDGSLLELQDKNAPWLGRNWNESNKYRNDALMQQEITDQLIAWLEMVNPGMSRNIDHIRIEWEGEIDSEIWMQISGIPADPYGEWITFVIRVEPDWQLQYFACISNG